MYSSKKKLKGKFREKTVKIFPNSIANKRNIEIICFKTIKLWDRYLSTLIATYFSGSHVSLLPLEAKGEGQNLQFDF